jgi:hypothetical protein
MNRSLRHLAFAGLAAVLVLALTESAAQAQFRRGGFPAVPVTPATANFQFPSRSFPSVPILGTPGVGVNVNPWVSPYTTLNQAAYNTAVMGSALRTIPPYALGYNPYIRSPYYSPGYAGSNPYLYLQYLYSSSMYAGSNPYSYNYNYNYTYP